MLFKPWITEYRDVFRPFGASLRLFKIVPGDFCHAFDGMSPIIIIFYSRPPRFVCVGNFVNPRHSK
jgi:hypothetical protein